MIKLERYSDTKDNLGVLLASIVVCGVFLISRKYENLFRRKIRLNNLVLMDQHEKELRKEVGKKGVKISFSLKEYSQKPKISLTTAGLLGLSKKKALNRGPSISNHLSGFK